MSDAEPRLPDELVRMPAEPLLPVERWLIAGSLLVGLGLLGVLLWISQRYFAAPHLPPKQESAMHLTSAAFKEGETIPARHTADGPNRSPPLAWSGVPEGTRSLVLICDDPDAPRGTWVHWVLYNLPAEVRALPEGVPPDPILPSGARQGSNDFGTIGYGGPSPPPGKPHRYFFKLYALDTELNLKEGASKQQVESAMQGHIKTQAQLMGRYGRRR